MTLDIKTYFSPKAFLQGLGVVAVLYVLIALYVLIQSGRSIEALEAKLESKTIVIEEAIPVSPVVATSVSDHKFTEDPHNLQPYKSGTPLKKAPIAGLYEKTDDGLTLPIVSSLGEKPFHAYKKPFTSSGLPYISLAVRHFGLSEKESDAALRTLPSDVTFILSPYAPNMTKWQEQARQAGHEVWIEVPAQTYKSATHDPGPQALLKDYGMKYNKERMLWALSQTSGYTGVAIDFDATFTRVKPIIEPVLNEALHRGLGFFQINSTSPEFFKNLAEAYNAPYAENGLAGMENLFENLEIAAQSRGSITAVISLDDVSLAELVEWIQTLEDKGIALAPVSATVTATSNSVVPDTSRSPAPTHHDNGH